MTMNRTPFTTQQEQSPVHDRAVYLHDRGGGCITCGRPIFGTVCDDYCAQEFIADLDQDSQTDEEEES